MMLSSLSRAGLSSGGLLTRANSKFNMTLSSNFDYIIIGAGIIGLTVAFELINRFPDLKILIVEKEVDVAQHASGRNSGVLHAGFYYTADSLKARFTVEGNRRMKAFCRANGVKVNETRKVVVAANADELKMLHELKRRGDRNGVTLKLIDEARLKAIDPNIKTYQQALYSPNTASVDPREVCQKLKTLLKDRVAFRFNTQVRQIRENVVSAGKFSAGFRYLVNCAGLYADKIAQQMDIGNAFTMLPFKGLYLKYAGDQNIVKTNVYPVPNLNNPFLGVHFTKTVNDEVKIGPTAIPAFWREHYRGFSRFSLSEFAEVLFWEAKLFLRNTFNFRRLALNEMKKYLPHVLINEAKHMVRRIGDSFKPMPPGIRAQLLNKNTGELVMDFVVEHGRQSTHVLNAVSPAFTCAFSFAEYVVEEALKNSAPNKTVAEMLNPL